MKPLACALLLLANAQMLSGDVPSFDHKRRSFNRCLDRLPDTLNVGVPRIATMTREDTEKLREHIRSAFSLIARGREELCWPRPIQINVATGTDYQVLDWMSQGTIDAAIAPDLSLSLLSRDGIALYELTGISEDDATVLLPESRPEPLARPLKEVFARSKLDPLKEYDAFLNEVWAGAVAPRTSSPAHELILSSHLSSTGFTWPVSHAMDVFNERLASSGRGPDSDLMEKIWSRFFESTRFSIACDDTARCLEAALGTDLVDTPGPHPLDPSTVIVFFPGEEVLNEQQGANTLPASRPHLVVTAAAAKRMFDTDDPHLSSPKAATPKALQAMIDRAGRDEIPSVLRSVFVPEPVFGVRTYGFTIGEAMRLFQQQQRISGDKSLALVLPGGGVKAAYQTRIIEELYNKGYLRNETADISEQNMDALPVRTVIGTSGGALLGYFVSQLGAKPIDLFDVLWKQNGVTLRSTQIFGLTDLLRWFSIVATVLVLCILLFILAAPAGSPSGPFVYRWRPWLRVSPFFIIAPIAVSMASPKDIEHIPEIEGFLYAVMTLVVMIVDQVLIYDPNQSVPGAAQTRAESLRWRDVGLVLLGVAFLIPGLAPIYFPAFGSLLPSQLPFGIAFVTLVILILGGAIAAIRMIRGRIENPRRRASEIVGSVVVVLLLCSLGLVIREIHILAFLALLVIGAWQVVYVKKTSHKRDTQWILTLLAVFMIAELCWPREAFQNGWRGLPGAPSLEISAAAFFVSVGFILIVIGTGISTYRAGKYHLDPQRESLWMGLFVLLGYVSLTASTVWVLTILTPDLVTALELTLRFWLTLLIVSGVISLMIVASLKFDRVRQSRFGEAVRYLCGPHPNGTIVPRYARLLFIAVFAVTWWNVVQAPALYGNRQALAYHSAAIRQFNEKRCPPRSPCGSFEPTARFVAPANLLQQDGTRYFMFLPRSEEDCPAVPNRPASGAEWLVFRGDNQNDGGCHPKPSEEEIREVTFASGSPFPIFPAHTLGFVRHSARGGESAFVDGGYSNNIPVDAARTLGARQVLIIQSSCPLPPLPRESTLAQRVKKRMFGKLIRNSERLPGYLFERSQQVDRLSGRDMFVVSVSPSRNEVDWPPLFDFRSSVVERMRDTATADLNKRIGLVESWGQPSFALHSALIRSGPAATQ